MFSFVKRGGRLGFVLHALGQWALWVFACMLGFMDGWSFGRTLGLTLGDGPGADFGEAGTSTLGLGLGSAVGAPAFGVGFLAVAVLLASPVITVWGETGVRPERSRAWLAWALIVYFVVSFWTGTLLSWVVAPRFAPILGEPLPKLLNLLIWLTLLGAYLRRRLPPLEPGELSRLARRTAWLTIAMATVAVTLAATSRPWLGNGHCPTCG